MPFLLFSLVHKISSSKSPCTRMGSGWWMAVEDSTSILRIKIRDIYALYLLAALATAVPTITLPINSQVPPVARVNIPFKFTFSASTFSGNSSLSYTLSNAPSWLFLDGSTRTLSGIAPESATNTAPIIQITASDGTGSVTMNTTLVVSGNPAPSVVIPLEDQLAALGTYNAPSSILYYPSTPFTFVFDSGTFGSSTLNHYAITSDNTPLPAWIAFDGASLSFSGKTPDYYSLIQPPQTWGLQLIASDVLGFAGVAIEFNIVVGNHKLDFKDSFLVANATIGTFLNFTSLLGNLSLDGNTVNFSDIVSADAETPDWLKFSKSTFSLTGTPPVGATSFNISVKVVDVYGDTANAIVHIHITLPLFLKTVGSVNATIGMPFYYDVGSLFYNASDITVSVQIDPLTPWLLFDSHTLNLIGSVPSDALPSKIRIAIEAISKSSNASDSQILTLMVAPTANHTTSDTMTTSAIATERQTSSGSTTTTLPAEIYASKGLNKGEIAAVTVPVVLCFITMISLVFFCHRKKRHRSRKTDGSPDKSEISKPLPISSQTARERREQDWVAGSGVYATPSLSSNRHTAALTRDSQAPSNLVGRVSMNLRDSRSSGKRGRSYSENALSDFGSTWRYTQASAYPPLRISEPRRSSARNTRNFSRKTSVPLSLTNRSSGDLLESTISNRTSEASRSSIQQTPDFAYDSENIKQRLSRRRTPDYLGIPSTGRRLSGIGHGLQKTAAGYSATNKSPGLGGIGHGSRNPNSGPQNHAPINEDNSWVTIGSIDLKEQLRCNALSALTESTEMMNSPKKITLRRVTESPSQTPTVRMSMSSRSSQPSSKRAVGSSPFFGGSSRTESRRTSRKSMWLTRDKHLHLPSPPGLSPEDLTDGLENSTIAEFRGREPRSSDPAFNLARDSPGITYSSPREGTRQLRDYVSQLGHRASLSLRNSLQFNDNDSRFRSAEHSPQSKYYMGPRDQVCDRTHNRDYYSHSPQADASPSSFNRDRYGLDESPKLSQGMGAQALLPIAVTELERWDLQTFQNKSVLEKYMPDSSRPANSYGHGMVREKSLSASQFDLGLDDNADISVDGLYGAFL